MTGDWLYPLSSVSGYVFDLRGGSKTKDTGPPAFEQMVSQGGADHWWGAYRNWKQLQVGDRIWVYYGTADGDVGVTGLGRVLSVSPPPHPHGRAAIQIKWDIRATKSLCKCPFPAGKVRKDIPRAIAPLWEIKPPLARKLRHHLGAPSSPSRTASTTLYASGKPSTVTYKRPPRHVTVHRRHDALLRPLLTRLKTAGWREVRVNVQTKRVDLAMRLGSITIIVEAKTSSGSSSQDVRDAFSQLKEYAWRVQKSRRNSPASMIVWALFEVRPDDDAVSFLEDHGVFVSWADARKRRIVHSRRTAQLSAIRKLGS